MKLETKRDAVLQRRNWRVATRPRRAARGAKLFEEDGGRASILPRESFAEAGARLGTLPRLLAREVKIDGD